MTQRLERPGMREVSNQRNVVLAASKKPTASSRGHQNSMDIKR